jgi:HTH-type transcriptional regulator / antitoxin HigA
MSMATKTIRQFKGKLRDDYLELIARFPLTSIRTEEDLQAAQVVLDELLSRGKFSAGESLYLDALSDLVASYEDDHYQFESPTDAGMLRHLLEAKGIGQIELHRSTGIAKSTISEILAGKKPFSRHMIGTLATFFGVHKSVLTGNL